MQCLLITSYFPPVIGGSATVYGNIYKYGDGKVKVLTTMQAAGRDGSGNAVDGSDGIYRIKELMAPSVACHNLLQTAHAVLRYDLPTRYSVLKSVIAIIKKENIDVVCLGELHELGWLVGLLRRLTRVKIVIYTHGEEITTRNNSRFYGKNAQKYLDGADCIVCVSRYTYDVIQSRYAIPGSKLRLITNGIDISAYAGGNTDARGVERAGDNRRMIFSAGRHIERKGFDMAIRAMAIVRETLPDARLVIAGEGEDTESLRSLVNSLGLDDEVSLVGRVAHDELTAFYGACDVFLMPNRTLENGDTEGFGLVFLEANAFGKPVIGGNAGGVPDAIVDGKTGLLVDGNSTDEIAAAIVELLKDDSRRHAMGDAALEWARANNVENKVAEFVDCCESLLA